MLDVTLDPLLHASSLGEIPLFVRTLGNHPTMSSKMHSFSKRIAFAFTAEAVSNNEMPALARRG